MTTVTPVELHELEMTAVCIREDIIRMITAAGSGHPGSSLSAVEILVSLYYRVMKNDPHHPDWPERDRFVLSKGHGVPVLYAILADRGFYPKEWLMTLRQVNSHLQGHPSRVHTPGIEVSGGSLGQGVSVGVGMALAARIDHKPFQTYVLLGDGELDEGQVWEAAAIAPVKKLDNLKVILDANGFQLSGSTQEIMPKGDIAGRWRAFGWEVVEIDGQNFNEVIAALELHVPDKPVLVLAHTVKGKGVSFMENNNHFHGVAPTRDEAARAMVELEDARKKLAQ